MAWELTILNGLQEMRTPFLDAFFKYITLLGEAGIFCIILGLVLLFPKKTRVCGACVLLGLLLDVLICNVTLKPLIGRMRPCWVNPAIKTLIPSPSDYSFPSGHSAACFVTATCIYRNHRRWGVFALILASLVGLSRLYLYMHWPTDVLAGAVLGVILGVFACKILQKHRHKVKFLAG